MMKKYASTDVEHAVVALQGVGHVAVTAVAGREAPLREGAEKALDSIRAVVQKQTPAHMVVAQSVFLRDPRDQRACQELFAAHLGSCLPVTTYVHQPPCNGSALAIEAWAVARDSAKISRHDPHVVSVSYKDVTWVHCGGIVPGTPARGVYDRSSNAFTTMKTLMDRQGMGFDHMVRTWLYLGDIVGPEGDTQRYKELNRARSDFYRHTAFCRPHLMQGLKDGTYPASTGIGMGGSDVAMSCLAMDTSRKDVFLLPLENPQQVPAFKYHAKYSPQSPKFSRAMAVVMGEDVIIFVSGTASIVNSETKHIGNVEKQTEQTIENIERLIARENFAAHKLPGAGATLADMALVRVYVKRPEDYAKCRAVCERRFGQVPTVYTAADVCRPELLVELEGVAFSKRTP